MGSHEEGGEDRILAIAYNTLGKSWQILSSSNVRLFNVSKKPSLLGTDIIINIIITAIVFEDVIVPGNSQLRLLGGNKLTAVTSIMMMIGDDYELYYIIQY